MIRPRGQPGHTRDGRVVGQLERFSEGKAGFRWHGFQGFGLASEDEDEDEDGEGEGDGDGHEGEGKLEVRLIDRVRSTGAPCILSDDGREEGTRGERNAAIYSTFPSGRPLSK